MTPATKDSYRGYELEYIVLRSEMERRMEWRNTIVFSLITAAAAILGFGFENNSPHLILLYPPVAAFLAALWAQNDIRIIQLGKYIRQDLEPAIGGMHWQADRNLQTERPVSVFGVPLLLLAGGGFFLYSEVFALAFAWLTFGAGFGTGEWLLFAISAFSLAFTGFLGFRLWTWERLR